MADKFGLRTWTINLRTWIFGFTCLVFKTTCIDRRIPLREGAFFFTRRTLFPPLNKRNTRDKAKGLCIASARYIGEELGAQCLSTLNRGQDSRRQSLVGASQERACCYCGEGYGKDFVVGVVWSLGKGGMCTSIIV